MINISSILRQSGACLRQRSLATLTQPSRFALAHKALIHRRPFSTPSTPTATLKQLSESFINGTSAVYVEEMFHTWKKNPQAVHSSWDTYFKNVERGAPAGEAYMSPPTLHHGAPTPATPSASVGAADVRQRVSDSMKLLLLVRAYQVRGHVLAKLDPLEIDNHPVPPELTIERYGFTQADLDREIFVGDNLISGFLSSNRQAITLREVLDTLKKTYCSTIGVEYMHIQEREKCDWMRERFETPTKYSFSSEEKKKILDRLCWADQFERFLGMKFKTQKRFGLDGCESFIPGMKHLIDTAADLGVQSVVIGMPHRGRLNVLANVVRKPLATIFSEFGDGVVTSDELNGSPMSGDVKYHLGTSYDRPTRSGKKIHLSLVANPSHLEAVNPVVEGKARAKQYLLQDVDRSKVMPILLHGDAAFAGQGVVYESLHLSELPNYTTGGTVHIVVNNQIGFTTDPRSSRSSLYCTDVAKTVDAPIFHVNGDDVEAVVHVMGLAAQWRQAFKKDVVIDLVCYRRFGHNEMDLPQFTQPLMYQKINQQNPIIKKYSEKLEQEGVLTHEDYQKMKADIQAILEREFKAGQEKKPQIKDWLESQWVGFKSPVQLPTIRNTGVAAEQLQKIGKVISTAPDTFTPHNNIIKNLGDKKAMFAGTKRFDWATAEALAFGSLLLEGVHVRLSGQDVERGTFSHRHAVLHDQKNGQTYTPLQNLVPSWPKAVGMQPFQITNSSLSEFGVLGFELGYSLENPNALVMWEAQFGDFSNGAQVIVDQFLSSGEQKWMRQCGLVMLLPHGYDGAGPEHSSCRLERYLQLCDSDPNRIPSATEFKQGRDLQRANMHVVLCSTPANYFHVLRRQLTRDFRKPLVMPTHKWLLRYEASFSSMEDFSAPEFKRIYPEAFPDTINEPKSVKRLVFCSGQVYYYLLKKRQTRKIKDVALVRVEQLHPFPFDLVAEQIAQYPKAEVIWCQEEPMNMGAYPFVAPHFTTLLKGKQARYAGRPVSASPSVASHHTHEHQLISFLSEALGFTPTEHEPPLDA
eukprot:TRINITY_DN1229_c0_g1_i2.p1 TRINITY_DN1229_c0_g1~~TRINITY_DN1229_c0_g1_i2.p1  ORF type:complete len:1032 (+),score=379.58 TRINITY_DN1229_c0_g1_i2:101-3196(+)